MATVKVTCGQATASGAQIEVVPRQNQTITSSASSQQSTVSARSGEIISVTASGGAVHALFGDNPTVTTANSHALIPDGGTRFFGGMKDEWTVAIIDA